jgi:peptidoglycan/xylan/chitin deacetylase (PgdA/CDA1 family)
LGLRRCIVALAGWLFGVVALAPPTDAAAAQAERAGPAVQLYTNAATSALVRQAGGRPDAAIAVWRASLSRSGIAQREIGRDELIGGKAGGVLVLPSVAVLDDAERQAIGRWLARGGSVLASASTGTVGPGGQPRGHAFIESTFGVRVTGSARNVGGGRFLAPFGDSPVTHGLPAGQRMWLRDAGEPIVLVTADRVAGRLTDYVFANPHGVDNGVLAFDERGAARVIYLGFPEASWDSALADMDRLAADAIAWLAREPRVFKAAWPGARESAQLVEMDTEWYFEYATRLVEMLDRHALRGTFYCLTSVAVPAAAMLKRIGVRHEIAYHGEVHIGFKGLPEAEQASRLDRMVREMRLVLGDASAVTGFRAPLESFDATTEKLLRARGVRHHAVHIDSSRARLPFFSTAEPGLDREQAIVNLPRTQLDDLNLAERNVSGARAAELLLRDLRTVMEMRGLGLLSVHSYHFGPSGGARSSPAGGAAVGRPGTDYMVEPTERYLEALARARARHWIAPAGEIAQWWRARARVEHRVTREADRVQLELQVRAPGDVRELALIVTPRARGAAVAAMPRVPEHPLPRVVALDEFRVALVFDRLGAGSYRYWLNL